MLSSWFKCWRVAPLDTPPEHDRSSCYSVSAPTQRPTCINQRVYELISKATNPMNLSQMPASWAPFY